jgi:predicted DNA-binding protein
MKQKQTKTMLFALRDDQMDDLNYLANTYSVKKSVIIRNLIDMMVKDPNLFVVSDIVTKAEQSTQNKFLLFRVITEALKRINPSHLTDQEAGAIKNLMELLSVNIGNETKNIALDLAFNSRFKGLS